MKLTVLSMTGLAATIGISYIFCNALAANATDSDQAISTASRSTSKPMLIAGLFDVIRIVEDVDDLAKGNIGGITPVKRVNRQIERGLDDVNDAIEDTGKDVRRAGRKIDRELDDIADDVNDWFD